MANYFVCNTSKVKAVNTGGRLHSAVLTQEVPNGALVFVEGYKTGDLDKFWTSDEDRIFVAKDKTVVGFLSVEVYHENEDYIYLNDFAVTKEYRNRGIGSALLKAAESYAHEINTLALCLHVEKSNLSTMQFYENSGYAVYRDDGQRFLMTKELSPE